MSKAKQTEYDTRASRETLLTMLEILPDAFFVVDDSETIVYANARAQVLTGTTREEFYGKPFWRSAPQLVSPALYQAVRKAKQTQEPTEVEYGSAVIRSWLRVYLSPTVGGLLLHFHEGSTPTRYQEPFSHRQPFPVAALDSLHARIGVLTPEGTVLDFNEDLFDETSIRREEVIGKPLAETPWWSGSPAGQAQIRTAIKRASTGERVRFETQVHRKEGMVLDIEATITPQRDVDDQIESLAFVGLDITARKRAEEELRVLIDVIPQVVWTARPDGSIEYGNQRLREYTGMTIEQIQEDKWLQQLHPDDRQQAWAAWQTAIHTSLPYEGEWRLRNGITGDYRWFLFRAAPLTDRQGTILQWFGTCTDIEEHKRTAHKLKESEEHLRVLAETVPQLMWMMSPDGQHEYMNQRWRDYTGLTLEQMQSDRWAHLQFIHPDDREDHRTHLQHALDTGEMYEHEERLRQSQTGLYRWFLVRAMPVRDETGQIIQWFGTCTDIDERKRMEEALRQSQERASALMNSSIIGINLIEGEQMVDANEAFLRMTGYTREDLCAGHMNVMDMTPPEYLARTQQAHQELASLQSLTPYEKEYLCKDGSRLPVVVGGVILKQHPHQAIAFVLDNSARKELEQRKDDFISMASHELRNPITVLKLRATLLHRQLARQGIQDSAPALSSMEVQIEKAARLVEELLDVSKIQAGRLEYRQEIVDLDALLREIADTMQHTHPGCRILMCGAMQASLMGDRDRLGQVFTNLLSNAIKYSPGAETVEMDLSFSSETATVSVRDHGLGIPREQRDKIFERFYRAAGPKQKAIPGLGMGLYIVAEIIQHYGGTITVDSAVGKGSTFTVTLPRTCDA